MGSGKYEEHSRKLLAHRSRMKGVTAISHFACLDERVRRALEDSFRDLSDKELSAIIGFPMDTFALWRTQSGEIMAIKNKLRELRGEGKNLSRTHLIRPQIAALAKKGGVRPVAQLFGVPRSSLARWVKNGWDKIDSFDLVDVSEAPPSEEVPRQLADMDEARELKVMLARHEGKGRKKYSRSEQKLFLSLAERFGSKAVHDHFKVSYDTLARLKLREVQQTEKKIRVPIRYAPVLDLMKQHPGMGPMQIRDYLRRHLGLAMGVNSIRKVMEFHGWVPPFTRSPRIKEDVQIFEATRRNYLWHMDFKHQYINQCKVFILFIQDDYSRFITGFAVADGEKVDTVLDALSQAIKLHGRPEVVMSDGGSAFYSWRGVSQLTRFFEDFGIDQYIAKTPNVNGKLENLNQQFEKEKLLTSVFSSLQHFEQELASWVGFYNFKRPHQGLSDRLVPADRYYPGACVWYSTATQLTTQQSLIAETMATLLNELRKSNS